MSTLCLIPARGGSKGVLGKNLREVAGRPLIDWTIQQALAITHSAVRVVVSTDDEEIANVARGAGAEVPFRRPATLAGDTTPTEPVVLHCLDALAESGFVPDAVMLLQATSPVRLPGTLDRALTQFDAERCDSLVGVVPETPFLWRQGDPPAAEYDYTRRPRRQDLNERNRLFRETGSLYLTRTDVFRSQQNRLGGRISLFVMDEVEGSDIDSETDLMKAHLILEALLGGAR